MNVEPTTGHGNEDEHGANAQPEWLRVVRQQVESLKFGTIQITVHESNVVQIERVEKLRLDRVQKK